MNIGSGSVTTFAEYTVVAENRITPILYNPNFKHIYPLIGCALSTSWGILTKEAQAKKENTLLICGGGGVGMAIVFWAKLLKLKKCVVFDRNEIKRSYIEKLGGSFYSIENGEFP